MPNVSVTPKAQRDFKEFKYSDDQVRAGLEYLSSLIAGSPVIDRAIVTTSGFGLKRDGHEFVLHFPSVNIENNRTVLGAFIQDSFAAAEQIPEVTLRDRKRLGYDPRVQDPLPNLGRRKSFFFPQDHFGNPLNMSTLNDYFHWGSRHEAPHERLARLYLLGLANAFLKNPRQEPIALQVQNFPFDNSLFVTIMGSKPFPFGTGPASLTDIRDERMNISHVHKVFEYWFRSYAFFGDPFSPLHLSAFPEAAAEHEFVFQSPMQVLAILGIGVKNPKRVRFLRELESFRLWIESMAIQFWDEAKKTK